MSKDRAAQLVEAGIWLKLSGDGEGARKLFERALKLDPGNEKASQLLAGGQGALDAAQPSGVKPAAPAQVAPPSSAPPRAQADWQAATGYSPVKTPSPTLDSEWGRGTPVPTQLSAVPTSRPSGWGAPMTVTLGSTTPVPQPAPALPMASLGSPVTVRLGSMTPVPQAPPAAFSAARTITLGSPSPVPQPAPALGDEADTHRGATMQFARPSEVTLGETEPPHRAATMQFARPTEVTLGETEPPHRAATMQFARPTEVEQAGESEAPHRGATMQFARPTEVPLGETEAPHRAATMQFARPPEVEQAGESEAPHRGATMQFARPAELDAALKAARAAQASAPSQVAPEGTAAAEPAAWDVPAWDTTPAMPVAPPPAAPETPRGSTMQFVRPPELEAAVKAARAAQAGGPGGLVIEPMSAAPEVRAAESVPATPPLAAPEAAWDVPAWDTTPAMPVAPPPAPPETPRGSTMQFVRPPELEAAVKAARAQQAERGPGGLLIEPMGAAPELRPSAPRAAPTSAVPPPAPQAEPSAWDVPAWDLSAAAEAPQPVPEAAPQKGGTMQFARPSELEAPRARTTGEFSRPPEVATTQSAGRTMQFARPPELVAALKATRGAPAAVDQDIIEGELEPAPAVVSAGAASTEPSPWDVVPWDASAPSPRPQAPVWADSPETAPGGTMVQFERPAEVKAAAQATRSAPSFGTTPAPAAPLPWNNTPSPVPAPRPSSPDGWASAAESQKSGSMQRFRTEAFDQSHTVSLSGDPGPEATPHSTPPLFGYTAGGHPAPEAAPSLADDAASKGGLQALGAMLGPDAGLPGGAPSSPPLFSGPAVAEAADATPPSDAMGFAWAWSGSSPPPRPQDDDLSLVPRPSPAFAPKATSAWDARSNPGLKIESVAGEDRALDLIASSDSKLTRSPEAQSQVPSLLKSARALLDLDDHSGAMELILKAQALAPDDPDVKGMRERSEKTLLTMFESKLGRLETVPRVLLKDDEIIWLNLDHRAGFVLAQIDGTVSFDDLFSVSGMSRIDTARILAQLVEEGVISRG